MRTILCMIASLLISLGMPWAAMGQQETEFPILRIEVAATQPAAPVEPKLSYPHPTLPPHQSTWAGATVIVILFMFFMAAVVGVLVQLDMPEEVPPAHSHDEPPGTSGHHGAGGTANPQPEDTLRHGHH